MLINEILVAPPITSEEYRRYQLYKFFEGKHLFREGGLDDQLYPEIMSLRRVSFLVSICEAILDIRDKKAQQNMDLEKLAKTVE